jgi:hypothetical protein
VGGCGGSVVLKVVLKVSFRLRGASVDLRTTRKGSLRRNAPHPTPTSVHTPFPIPHTHISELQSASDLPPPPAAPGVRLTRFGETFRPRMPRRHRGSCMGSRRNAHAETAGRT